MAPRRSDFNLSRDLGDGLLDGRGVGAPDSQLVLLLAILVEQEGGHGGDAVVGGDFGELIDIDLVELDGSDAVAQLLDERGNRLARTTPGGEEVDNDGLLAVLDELLPLLSTVDKRDSQLADILKLSILRFRQNPKA